MTEDTTINCPRCESGDVWFDLPGGDASNVPGSEQEAVSATCADCKLTWRTDTINRNAFQRAAGEFYTAAVKLLDAWDGDDGWSADDEPKAYNYFPSYLPSFEEFVTDIGAGICSLDDEQGEETRELVMLRSVNDAANLVDRAIQSLATADLARPSYRFQGDLNHYSSELKELLNGDQPGDGSGLRDFTTLMAKDLERKV